MLRRQKTSVVNSLNTKLEKTEETTETDKTPETEKILEKGNELTGCVDEYAIYKEKVLEYAKTMNAEIMTIRYNNEMFHYYTEFLKYNKGKIGCAYGVVKPISNKIKEHRKIYVLEMNNEENKIMAIGRIAMTSIEQARTYHKKYYIYPKMSMLEKYNRYLYFGTKRISRETMDETQEHVMKILDQFCFTGCGNLKRGIGITHFPFHYLYECSKYVDFAKFIDTMFL